MHWMGSVIICRLPLVDAAVILSMLLIIIAIARVMPFPERTLTRLLAANANVSMIHAIIAGIVAIKSIFTINS